MRCVRIDRDLKNTLHGGADGTRIQIDAKGVQVVAAHTRNTYPFEFIIYLCLVQPNVETDTYIKHLNIKGNKHIHVHIRMHIHTCRRSARVTAQ